MKKILAVLVNYGQEQLKYLEEVVKELSSFTKYEVSIIVQSNIQLSIKNVDKINVVELNDYQLLPLTCRKEIWDRRNDFDIFIYGENDHLFKEHHVDKHLEYLQILPQNRISGLIQYEEDKSNNYYYPGYHLDFEWDYNSVEVYQNKVFAHFTNLHQASFIITKTQLIEIGEKINFNHLVIKEPSLFFKVKKKFKKWLGLKPLNDQNYSVKCKVNTDLYEFAGKKKLICISEFEDNLIHHLPNLYIEGEKGRNKLRSDDKRMQLALSKLMSKVK